MTNSEYQNKIISLLDELSCIFLNIRTVLDKMFYQKTCIAKQVLKENVIESLREELANLINQVWDVIDEINSTIKDSKAFDDTEKVSEKIRDVILRARSVNDSYISVKEAGLLDQGLISSKRALLSALKDISDYIIDYNKKFDPKIKSLKTLLSEAKVVEEKEYKELYEGLFHETPQSKEKINDKL